MQIANSMRDIWKNCYSHEILWNHLLTWQLTLKSDMSSRHSALVFLCNVFWFAKKQLFCKCLGEKNACLAIFRWYALIMYKNWYPFLKKIGIYHAQKKINVVKAIRWYVIVSEYYVLWRVCFMSGLFSNVSTSWHAHADYGCTYTLVID